MSIIERLLEPRHFERKNKIITITGVSASGKDHLVLRARKISPQTFGNGLSVFNLGHEISKLVASDNGIDTAEIQDRLKYFPNKELNPHLLRALNLLLGQQPAIYLTHVVCKQQDDLVMSPECERIVNTREYIFVYANPEQISRWRNAELSQRKREVQSLEEIALHQRIAHVSTLEIASALGAGYLLVHNKNGTDEEAANAIIEEVKMFLL